MANIFDLPDFMFTGINRNNLTKLRKIKFLVKGLFLGFIHKNK